MTEMRLTVAQPLEIPQNLLMLGVGGAGMAPLAIYLAQTGHYISGFDDNFQGSVRDLLRGHNIQLYEGGGFPETVDAVIYSSAVKPEHPLMQQAVEKGIPCLRRGHLLARLADEKKLLAVVGSHGKTTTTGMLIHRLRQSDFDFSYVLGGFFQGTSLPPARYSPSSEWLVAEVDESDGTIDNFHPELTLALNVDWDHPSQYPTAKDLETTFEQLFKRTRGAVWIPEGDKALAQVARASQCRPLRTFSPGGYSHSIGEVEKPRSSAAAFNIWNATAAQELSEVLCGVSGTASEVLAEFPGISRRQELLYAKESLTVIHDYAHHPAEVVALMELTRRSFPDSRLTVIFQPHRYTRTEQYACEFARVLGAADRLFLLDVYSAGELPLPGGHIDSILQALCDDAAAKTSFVLQWGSLVPALQRSVQRPEVMLFIGAGDIDRAARAYAAVLTHPQDTGRQWLDCMQALVSSDTRLKLDEPLSNKTTLGIGGRARCYANPANRSDLHTLVCTAALFGLEIFHLGRGSNLIVPDEGFDGLVIRLSHSYWRRIEPLSDGRLHCGAGVRLKELCARACRLGLGGMEFLEGIPGSLGGALRMNAGAMGGWIFDIVETVELMTPDGQIHFLNREAFQVGYRECRELREGLALGATLRSPRRTPREGIKVQLDSLASRRKKTQPCEPSAGCIFKNPSQELSAGDLIDRSGLKGKRIGRAEVSPVHANFIINRGGATCAEVVALMREVRATVKTRQGVVLEPEVGLLGKRWEQLLKG